MSRPSPMRNGLLATRCAKAVTAGTITVDSYTRTGDVASAGQAIANGIALNGYPIASYPTEVTRSVLRGIADAVFPVQVRHGSALPDEIFAAMLAAGLDATEGGPVSYCLPYSRTPLGAAVASWKRCCAMLASTREIGREPHLETFGGCMLGQLCPPTLLIALSILEALFFRQHGLRSISLSYAQQANTCQDEESVSALTRIATDLLPDVEWHVVVYAYMGLYPLSPLGARLLLDEAARLCVRTGAARLIVKTTAERHRIPTVGENIQALERAAATAAMTAASAGDVPDTGIYGEARALINAVLDLGDDIGRALVRAFAKGYLDVPFCLHPDNAGRCRSGLDSNGWLYFSETGSMPLPHHPGRRKTPILSSTDLLRALSYVQRTYDQRALVATVPLPTEQPGA